MKENRQGSHLHCESQNRDLLSAIKTLTFGGDKSENQFPSQYIRSIGFRGDTYVDLIEINGKRHGREKGLNNIGSITLQPDEYINCVKIYSHDYVDGIKLKTNLGRCIAAGSDGGNPITMDSIRVIAIGGKTGDYVDQLSITFVEHYKKPDDQKEYGQFIVGFTAPGTKVTEYKNSFSKSLKAYASTIENVFRTQFNASVEADMLAKVSFFTELEFKGTEISTVQSQLEEQLEKFSSMELDLDLDHVGIQVVSGEILESQKQHWMYPTSELHYLVMQLDDYANLLGCYDLTQVLDLQIPGLKKYRHTVNGFVRYGPKQKVAD